MDVVVFSYVSGDEEEAAYFREKVSERRAGFDRLFWNESLGIWRDAVLGSAQRDNTLNGSFYASSFAPLVWRCSQGGLEQDEKFLSTLESLRVLDYPGGGPDLCVEELQPAVGFSQCVGPPAVDAGGGVA